MSTARTETEADKNTHTELDRYININSWPVEMDANQ